MSLFSVNAILILNSDDGSRVFAKYYTAPHHTAGASHTSMPLPSPPLPPPPSPSPSPNPANTNRRYSDAPTAQTPYPDVKAQKAFEKGLVEKTAKQTADIILYDNRIVLYKSESDVMMYVVGGVDENEIMLYNVILALRDSLHLLFKYAPITSSFTSPSFPSPFFPSLPHLPLLTASNTNSLVHRSGVGLTGNDRQSVDKRTIIENYDLVSLAIDEIIDDGIILETDPTIIVQRVSKAPTQDVTQLKGIDLSEQGMNNLAQFGKAKLGDWLRQGL
jgi:coatomer subunit zeta